MVLFRAKGKALKRLLELAGGSFKTGGRGYEGWQELTAAGGRLHIDMYMETCRHGIWSWYHQDSRLVDCLEVVEECSHGRLQQELVFSRRGNTALAVNLENGELRYGYGYGWKATGRKMECRDPLEAARMRRDVRKFITAGQGWTLLAC